MSRKRLLYVLIALALVTLAVLSIRTAVATSAVVPTTPDAYDEVERNRSLYTFTNSGDRSYDEVERIRARRDSLQAADFSYDEIERNRSKFLITSSGDRSYNAPDLSDYALRHPGARIVIESKPDLSDYALRHPDARIVIESKPDLSDYALRHPELIHRATPDLSDWFLRHRAELNK